MGITQVYPVANQVGVFIKLCHCLDWISDGDWDARYTKHRDQKFEKSLMIRMAECWIARAAGLPNRLHLLTRSYLYKSNIKSINWLTMMPPQVVRDEKSILFRNP